MCIPGRNSQLQAEVVKEMGDKMKGGARRLCALTRQRGQRALLVSEPTQVSDPTRTSGADSGGGPHSGRGWKAK